MGAPGTQDLPAEIPPMEVWDNGESRPLMFGQQNGEIAASISVDTLSKKVTLEWVYDPQDDDDPLKVVSKGVGLS